MTEVDNSANDLKHRFALAVKRAREFNGLTQQELADKVDASLNHIGKLERGRYLPGLEVAAKLIGVLGIDANSVLAVRPATRAVSHSRLEDEAELQRLAETLDDRTICTAIELVTVLAKQRR
jgi:ribosome-binding protein aMBF1 (putative translation factor)